VLWVVDRSAAFPGDHHARDMQAMVTLGLDADGIIQALLHECDANLGAYLSWMGAHVPVNNLGGLSGIYRCRRIHARIRGVFARTEPTSPSRGAGRPEATCAIERAIDLAAAEIGIGPVELRRRNLIAPDQMPWQTGFVFTYDSGAFERNMGDALALADIAGLPARRAATASLGRLLGFVIANAIEIATGPVTGGLTESADVAFDPAGAATVTLGIHARGQGHVTSFAQIAADMRALTPEDIRIRFGNTEQIEHGNGTFGSRSAAIGELGLPEKSPSPPTPPPSRTAATPARSSWIPRPAPGRLRATRSWTTWDASATRSS
jgi:carbon-monoxide dehydrogenase large subunit